MVLLQIRGRVCCQPNLSVCLSYFSNIHLTQQPHFSSTIHPLMLIESWDSRCLPLCKRNRACPLVKNYCFKLKYSLDVNNWQLNWTGRISTSVQYFNTNGLENVCQWMPLSLVIYWVEHLFTVWNVLHGLCIIIIVRSLRLFQDFTHRIFLCCLVARIERGLYF